MSRSAVRLAFVVVVATLAAVAGSPARPSAQGGGVDPALYSGMQWRSVGPARGGRSIAAGGSDARPNEYYFGATGGGVWKTTDGGTTWAPVTDGKFCSRRRSARSRVVRVEPRRRLRRRWAKSQFRGNIIQGDGVYKTTDGGKTWTHVGLARHAGDRPHPRPPDQSATSSTSAVLGHPYGPSTRARRLQVDRRRQDAGASALPRRQDRRRRPDARSEEPATCSTRRCGRRSARRSRCRAAGPGSGLFKSTDGGDTWTELTRNPGLPAGLWGKIGVSVSPVDGNRVYAHHRERRDGGALRLRRRRRDVAADERRPPHAPARVLLLAHLRRPEGQGHRLRPQRPVLQVDRRRQDARRRSACRTATTTTCGSRPTDTAADDQRQRRRRQRVGQRRRDVDRPGLPDGAVLQRLHDRRTCPTTSAARSRTTRPPASRSQAQAGAGEGSCADLLRRRRRRERLHRPRPARPRRLLRRQLRRAAHAPRPRAPGSSAPSTSARTTRWAISAIDIKERFQWTFPIVFSPLDPDGALRRRRSTCGGRPTRARAGTKVSPDLTRDDPTTLGASGGPITLDQTGVETYATIFTIAPSPSGRRHHLDRLRRRRRARHARRGEDVDERDAARSAGVHAHQPHRGVAAPDTAPRTSPATATSCGDRRRIVYKTADYGQTWTKIVTGIRRARLPARDARGSDAARAAVRSAPSTASTSRSTTARRGSRCS